ncbi:Histone-lysine N-methyltransferase ATXR3 [Striga hermonthica]|uniref:Histone-lysine N-methyltransferase ATXR3 n=1 Tax=Striga hermonthica TaxID=68872 RepID=A0A9N7MIN8_STRHE|nr:Histone-lysine N-methyltransferase ATXR3 [Striga hermonthica]
MGDGGVACVPSQHVMEKFPICGGNGNGDAKVNSSSKPSGKPGIAKSKMKLKKVKGGGITGKKESNSVNNGSVDKDVADKNCGGDVAIDSTKEEVEEGELGTLPIEFIPEKPTRRYKVKSEVGKGEFGTPGKWRKNGDEVEKNDCGSSKDDLEKGEYVPDRWFTKRTADEYGHPKSRRYDNTKEKGWRSNRDWTSPPVKGRGRKFNRGSDWAPSSDRGKSWKAERDRSPPSSGKYSGEDFGRGQHLRKSSSRYEADKAENANCRMVVGEESSLKNHDSTSSRGRSKDYPFVNRLKRHNNDQETGGRKSFHADLDDIPGSKNRKLSNDGSHHNTGRNMDRPYRTPSEKYPSRYVDSSRAPHDRHNNSPHHPERVSPHERARKDSILEDSPARSSYDHGNQYDRSRSPYDRSRNRVRSPSGYPEQSPSNHGRNREDTDRGRYKSGVGEKWVSHGGSKGIEGKSQSVIKSQFSAKESSDGGTNVDNGDAPNNISHQSHHDELSRSPQSKSLVSSQENGVIEALESMEEDMDICDTPPHSPQVNDAVSGNWYYLDHYGVERGPSKLSDLKALLKDGYLASDHLIKHSNGDRWQTVEKAVSPLVTVSFQSVVPDTVTELACPPEAPGNLLADNGDKVSVNNEETLVLSESTEDSLAARGSIEDFRIDDRTGALLEGVTLVPGKEIDMLAEVLKITSEHGEWEKWGKIEGYFGHHYTLDENFEGGGEKHYPSGSELKLEVIADTRPTFPGSSENDYGPACTNTVGCFSGQWACKGGDWKRNEEATQDRYWKRKLLLNDGYPLCLMPKSGSEDPRLELKEELYCHSQIKTLELPPWAFTSPDELNDPSSLSRANQMKAALARGTRGMMLPVIRINACVVGDHGSFVSETRVKARTKERLSSRSSRPYSTTSETKRSSEDSHSKSVYELGSRDSSKKSSTTFSIPKDCLCRRDQLKLSLGDWYFLDGAGHERGPLSFSELQVMADQGAIQKHSSVFRKQDKIWVPVSVLSEPSGPLEHDNSATCITSKSEAGDALSSGSQSVSSSFHDMYPQFIGYTRGKLHELVMKSYKSREFAAAINEVLDPWISVRQPKKEIEKHIYHSERFHANKRARIHGFDEYEVAEDVTDSFVECQFDDLCGDVTFGGVELDSVVERGSWDILDGHVLARVFHFLKADVKSLFYAALTCKHWRSVVTFYKDISRQVDFCTIAPRCSDSVVLKIMNDYKGERITSLLFRGCTGITSAMLEGLLQSFPRTSSVDIRGCNQFEDLVGKFPNINWVRNPGPPLKFRSLNHLADGGTSISNQMEDSSGLKEYLESSDKRDSANQLFRRSLYKRSKLFDARKSSSILSRDAQLRRLSIKKTGIEYKRMERYIATVIQEIMSKNTFKFFEPKVADIEERMKNGYYATRGLNSIKEDISRMCRDAIKSKGRADAKDMNRIIDLFIQLATSLDRGSKLGYARDELLKSLKDDSPPGFSSSYSKSKKSLNRVTERKYRCNGTLYLHGLSDSGDCASDREIRKRLSKLNKKSLDSESDTSDDFGKSSDASFAESKSTASDTESDLESPSQGAIGKSPREACFISDDQFDSLADDREWGARMTKASLVPPVTRKYEVIDHYVIVADEEEVRRKMQVSLPEDYAEKLNAQRNGNDESDMEIPEVKDYKPRKFLGDEVLEQEVYGIDPYTHNLLLDSMPEESDWSLVEKHLFIEEVLLRTLNKQVRKFTGAGNTPMVYPLKSVFEEILQTADENNDRRTMSMCLSILRAIDSRPEDKYVAYRKGLGVVCNKEGGFSEDDFVVEFLGEVYPTWKWFEKQDGIRALQKNNKDPAPEFYNIYLERPKGDADGYDLVVVDAMHKANYASRICHSCRPNCEAKVTAVDGQYQIGIYSVRPIAYGEEITFDYNSVTESKEEYEASVCLCGNQVCRGSYLNLTGEGAFQKVLEEHHGLLDRLHLLLEACELNSVSEEDYIDLGSAGLGSCLLGGLPDWLIAYSARLVRFINYERTKLPSEILRHNIEEKKRYFAEIQLDVEKSDAEIQAEGVYNQRLQNLALTIDKVRYVMRCVFGDPKNAPPPLERLSPESAASHLWHGEGSFVEELIQCIAPHTDDLTLRDFKAKIQAHDPSCSEDADMKLRKSLLWLRDELRNIPCTHKSRHDAAADLIHIYAYTKYFFRIREYKAVTSPPVYITPLDIGPKYADKLGSGVHEYCKTYGETYCLGQLMFWHSQNAEPDATLAKASRGCLSLPEVGSFYARAQKPSRQRVYGPRTVKFMLSRMEKQPQRAWPKDRIWLFKSSLKIVGSPMLDSVLHKAPIDKEMVHWLKHRHPVFQAMWDR